MILYRPMNADELRLVYEMGMRGFPPRKPEQPIFYPVLNLEYANEISQRWNTEGQSAAGYVGQFNLDDGYSARFELQKVGTIHHVELWVPSEELSEFNKHIISEIKIVSAFFGANFQGFVPSQFGLRGKDATAQFVALARTLKYSAMDFQCEIAMNHIAIFLNYAFWKSTAFENDNITKDEQEHVLNVIQNTWASSHPEIHLPLTCATP